MTPKTPQWCGLITTRYLGPSNYRGSRVVARSFSRRATFHWDDAFNADENHLATARAMMAKIDEDTNSLGSKVRREIVAVAPTHDNRGYCFLFRVVALED